MNALAGTENEAGLSRETIEELCLLWLVSEQQRTPEELAHALGIHLQLAKAVDQAYNTLVDRGLVLRLEGALRATEPGVRQLRTELESAGAQAESYRLR
jgi:hypothetical protein